jgi:hypothetical protein
MTFTQANSDLKIICHLVRYFGMKMNTSTLVLSQKLFFHKNRFILQYYFLKHKNSCEIVVLKH